MWSSYEKKQLSFPLRFQLWSLFIIPNTNNVQEMFLFYTRAYDLKTLATSSGNYYCTFYFPHSSDGKDFFPHVCPLLHRKTSINSLSWLVFCILSIYNLFSPSFFFAIPQDYHIRTHLASHFLSAIHHRPNYIHLQWIQSTRFLKNHFSTAGTYWCASHSAPRDKFSNDVW